MKKIITLLLLIVSTFIYSQTQEATTKNGKTVILNEDGTWIYKKIIKSADGMVYNDEYFLNIAKKITKASDSFMERVTVVYVATRKPNWNLFTVKYYIVNDDGGKTFYITSFKLRENGDIVQSKIELSSKQN